MFLEQTEIITLIKYNIHTYIKRGKKGKIDHRVRTHVHSLQPMSITTLLEKNSTYYDSKKLLEI